MATSVVETITPAKAKEYLDKSGGNRNISKVVVDKRITHDELFINGDIIDIEEWFKIA